VEWLVGLSGWPHCLGFRVFDSTLQSVWLLGSGCLGFEVWGLGYAV